jgi:hypothetical protein
MTSKVLNYISSKRRRRQIPWHHWIPLAALVLFFAAAGIYACLHWNDPQFWDL